MVTTVQPPHVFWEEKISIEPDLGDQRQSTYKALPSPPKTPKRVMMKYRFSGVFPLILSLAAFVLSLVVMLAGHNVGMFEGQYVVALNTSRLGQDIITFEKASATSAAPPASASASTTPSPLHPADLDNPLNILGGSLGSLADNFTDAINDGLGDAINGVVEGVVNRSGIGDFYYIYLQKICSGTFDSGESSNADGIRTNDCRSYEEARESISALSKSVRSSIAVGQTRVSIPLLAKLVSSVDSILGSLDALRKAVFAFLVIALIGSILSVISVLPAMYFPQSRLLVYANMFWPGLASVFAFGAAVPLSAIVALAGVLNGISDTVGVQIQRGGIVLLLVWLSFVSVSLVTFYWTSVWFVESRKSSFTKRRREEDEIGHWRGIGNEVWRDVKGRRRQPRMRAGI